MSVARSEQSNQIRSSSFSFSLNDDDDDVSSVEDTLMLASERLTVAVQSFLQAFCTKDRPLVLFMDDLQWCDEESWKILSAILEGCELTHFLFLGGYRDEESDALQQRLKTIFENKATTAATTTTSHKTTIDLPLQNLDIASINELVSDALSSDLEQTLALSEIVRNKTLGNPYFAIQFLTTLQAQGLLTYHYGIMQWKWDLGQVKIHTELSENVVDVVTTRIQMLDSNAKRLLKLGSCLGFVFELELLEKLYHDTDAITVELLKGKEEEEEEEEDDESKEDHPDTHCSGFETSLDICETRGFLQRSGGVCTFTHDRIQQSVYELLPEGKMDKIHFCIGTCLRTSFDIESNPRYLRLTVEQLNLGLSTLLESSSSDINNNDGGRLSLIQLNYTAAISAKKHLGASATAEFLEKAIELSRKQDYQKEKQHYPLILNIYSMSAEAELSRGNIDQSLQLIGCILKMATCDMDQVRARIVHLQIQGFKQNYSLAIQQGRELLRILGEKLPSSSKLNVYLEYKKSRRMFRRLSDDDLEALHRTGSDNKETLDHRRELIVDILQTLATLGWVCDPQLLTLCSLRMAIVCAKGYSSDMAAGFGWYAAVLIGFGKMKEAFRFEQLAFRKVGMGRSLPGTCQMLVALISHCFKPAALMLKPLVTAYRVGLEVGEVYFGCLDIAVYSGLYAFCGLPLDTLAADMRKYGGQIKLCHQNYALSYVVQNLHFANNLRGVSADPTDFSRDSMKQYNCFSDDLFLDENDPSFLCNIYYTAFTSFLLGKLDQAKDALAKVAIGKVTRFSGCHFVNHMYRFIEGIVGFAIWRSSPKNKKEYLRLARRVLREVQGLVEKKLMNCAGIYELLLAENATTLRHSKNKIEENIKPLYDKAIVTLSRNGFLHFAAIANELAGELFLLNADPFWGRHYLSQAYTLYSDWGATAKLDQLKKSHDFLNNSNTGRVSTNLHGRQCYNPELDSMKGSSTTSVLREMVANSVHN